jgi:tripartite-type tricarboxylate transporter receptor subunit TctC
MKRIVAATLAALTAGIVNAGAQSYPSRPITIIAPFPAGGPLDSIARILAEPMREALGQPVVIENVPGAGGNLGVGRVARAEPDGYTIGIGQWSTHVVNPVTYTLPYNVQTDFEPIALLTTTPQLIIARKDFPAKDLKEMIAWLKAMQDMAAGQVDLMFDQAANALGPVRAGSVKAYAVMSKTRWAALPDVPSIDEAGATGLYVAFSNRPFGVKHFQAIHQCSVDVAHGLALLFGIGTKAVPPWDSRTRRNNLLGGLAVS